MDEDFRGRTERSSFIAGFGEMPLAGAEMDTASEATISFLYRWCSMSLLTLKDLTTAFGWLCTCRMQGGIPGIVVYIQFCGFTFLLCATRICRTGRRWIGLSRGSPWVRWGKHSCSAWSGGEWYDLLESDPFACGTGMPVPSSSQRLRVGFQQRVCQILFNRDFFPNA